MFEDPTVGVSPDIVILFAFIILAFVWSLYTTTNVFAVLASFERLSSVAFILVITEEEPKLMEFPLTVPSLKVRYELFVVSA